TTSDSGQFPLEFTIVHLPPVTWWQVIFAGGEVPDLMRVGREAGARSPRRILQEAPSICNVPDATLTSNQVPTLRITHSAGQVEAAREGEGPRKIERRPFTFTLSPQEAEDIRWYLEDYRIYPVDPAPEVPLPPSPSGGEKFPRVPGGFPDLPSGPRPEVRPTHRAAHGRGAARAFPAG